MNEMARRNGNLGNHQGNASVKITDTPEFKEAVAAAAAEAAKSAVAALMSSAGAPVSAGTPADDMMNKLAMAIAELTDQNTDRRRVPPEEMVKRRAAHERMGHLILEARKRGDKPQYKILNKVYLNERFIEPFRRGPDGKPVPSTVTWTGVPNEYMAPLDAVAREISTAYRESIGAVVDGPTIASKPLWMTAAGLVVQGDPPQSMKVSTNDDGQPIKDKRFDDELGLNVTRANDPTAEFVNILGTVAPPARQNTHDRQRT